MVCGASFAGSPLVSCESRGERAVMLLLRGFLYVFQSRLRVGEVGSQVQGGSIVFGGGRGLALIFEGAALPIERRGRRRDCFGLAEILQGGVEFALVALDCAAAHPTVLLIRIQREGFGELGYGLIAASELSEKHTQIVVGLGSFAVVGGILQCELIFLQRLIELILPLQENAEVVVWGGKRRHQ